MKEQMQALLDTFLEALRQEEKDRRPGDGLLGFGPKPGDAPSHSAFDRRVAALLGETGERGGPETGDAVELLLRAVEEEPWPEAARWTLIAAQRHALPLIPEMNPEQAAALAAWYEKRWPRFSRLPVQREVLRALIRRGRGE